jgi:membrane protein implicated in regulation of membrane protease activity
VTEQHQSPAPFDPALYLIEKAHQSVPPTFRPAPQLPPRRTAGRWLWEHFGRIAPGLATSSMSALAWSWGQNIPDGSTTPLWITGTLAALAGCAGCVAASKQHGDNETVRLSFGGAAVLAFAGVTAWTPDWQLATLLWAGCTAAVYAVCAPMWRKDRTEARAQAHELVMEETKGVNEARVKAIEVSGAVAQAQWEYRQEQAKVEAIVAAAHARQQRAIQPDEELDVQALLKAARIAELN